MKLVGRSAGLTSWRDLPSVLSASAAVGLPLSALRALTVHNVVGLFDAVGAWGADFGALARSCPSLAMLEVTCCPGLVALTDAELTLPPSLAVLVVTHCDVSSFEPTLPPTLRRLDLRHNRLEHLPACLEAVAGGTLELSLNGNDLWFAAGSDVPLGRVNRDTIGELVRAHRLHVIGTERLNTALRVLGQTTTVRINGVVAGMHSDQSVHMSCVQSSVSLAVTRVMSTLSVRPYDVGAIERLARSLDSAAAANVPAVSPGATLRRWCAEGERHPVHGAHRVSMGSLCERLALLLEAFGPPEVRAEAYSAIAEEVARNPDVCFTGRITHVLCALGGFVPGFEVGVSAKEELQGTIAAVRNRWALAETSDVDAYLSGAIPEAMQLLEDACVPEREQAAWLEAL